MPVTAHLAWCNDNRFVYLLGLNIWGYIATVPAYSSDTFTNVLPHRNAMLQTQDMTSQPRHSIQTRGRPVAVLSFDVTLEYTTTHLTVSGQTQSRNPSPALHKHAANAQLYDSVTVVVAVSQKLGRKCIIPSESSTRDV